MLAIPELALLRTRKVTTVCNGKREVWEDREEAKDYFLRQACCSDGEEHERYECVFAQIMNEWSDAAMTDLWQRSLARVS